MVLADMGFGLSLLLQLAGGVAVAATLTLAAALYTGWQGYRQHDAAVVDLEADTRRWLGDRDRGLRIEMAATTTEMNRRGLLTSGIHIAALAENKRTALHEYRDDISRKRRAYRTLRGSETWAHEQYRGGELDRYEMTDDDRAILARWRETVIHTAMPNDPAPVDDPTSEEREPDIRRFEREGDPPKPRRH